MQNFESKGIEKLKKVLINDKHFHPEKLNNVLASDIFKVLQNYMDFDKSDMLTRLDIDENGDYILRCKVKCKRLKIIGLL